MHSPLAAFGLVAALAVTGISAQGPGITSKHNFFILYAAGPVVEERVDPIITPGSVSAHVHTVFGGNAITFSESYSQAQTATCSTVAPKADKSNYWFPKLYFQAENGTFIDVQSGQTKLYYEPRPNSDSDYIYEFPEGFRMISGNPFIRSSGSASEGIGWGCLDFSTGYNEVTPGIPNRQCPDGLIYNVHFPACGATDDGTAEGNGIATSPVPGANTHVVFPSTNPGSPDTGGCPSSHPKHYPNIFAEVYWNTAPFADMWYGSGQPFVLAQGDPTGYGLHGDFLNGWDSGALIAAINGTAAHGYTDYCNTGDGGDVSSCFEVYSQTEMNACQAAVTVDEPTHGDLPALPGCNPVQPGPATATQATGCGATTAVGTAEEDFTDVTGTKHWAYLGCGTDGVKGTVLSANTMGIYGNNPPAPGMTVEACIDFCTSKGNSIAGVEDGKQCFCDNSMNTDNGAQGIMSGLSGKCNMGCQGNSTEICGGSGFISLYQQCGSTCTNAVASSSSKSVASSGSSGTSGGSSVAASSASASSAASSAPVSSAKASSSAASANEAVATPVAPIATATDSTPSSATSSAATSTATVSSTTSDSNVTLPAGWQSLGCYIDPVNPRALPNVGWWGSPVTSSGCASFCAKEGYAYAGTENAGQCFCGNTLQGGSQASESDCNMSCEGGDGEICGGPARLSLFSKSSSKTKRGRKHRRAHGHHFNALS